jgi:hypothetical protein
MRADDLLDVLLFLVEEIGTMAKLALVLVLAIIPLDALAIVRYMIENMTCAEVRQALERDGVAILYRQGKSGIALYDRFVRDAASCPAGDMVTRERISVADTDDCRVPKCVEARRFGD